MTSAGGSGNRIVHRNDVGVEIEVLVGGAKGKSVVFIPSALRGASDFAALSEAVIRAGFRSVSMNPRGAGRSSAPPDDLTLHDMGGDIASVIRAECETPVHLVGHGLGNTFVRCTAADHADLVATVTLLACGPNRRFSPRERPTASDHFRSMFDPHIPEEHRLSAIAASFFAAGNDPRSWLGGWWPRSSPLVNALFRTDPDPWWTAGNVPILLIQGEEDKAAPPAAGEGLARELGADRARLVNLAHCGHAMLPERPAALAQLLVDFLREPPSGAAPHRPVVA
jgi:pimeloyl-ACP methyl ester carboxylesterase